MAEKGYQKNAWVLLVIIGVVSMIFGVASIIAILQSPTPYSLTQVTQRDEGVVIIGFGLFGTAISYKPFRSLSSVGSSNVPKDSTGKCSLIKALRKKSLYCVELAILIMKSVSVHGFSSWRLFC